MDPYQTEAMNVMNRKGTLVGLITMFICIYETSLQYAVPIGFSALLFVLLLLANIDFF
jgi:hypothetical protein